MSSCSDQMENKGAFITMGMDMKPNYTTYDAVVSLFYQISKRRLFMFIVLFS